MIQNKTLIATAGEALMDCICDASGAFMPRFGGAAYNFSLALARQGVPVSYLNPFSSDFFGQGLAAHLQEAGAVLAQQEPVEAPTSLAIVRTDEDGQPHYSFYRSEVADRATSAETLLAASRAYKKLKMVYTGCLALSPSDADVYLPWLAQQKAAGCKVIIDANLRPQVMPDKAAYRDTVWAALHLADIVKVSDEDLLHLLGAKPENQPYTQDDAYQFFQSLPLQILVFTQGKKGAWAWWRCQREGTKGHDMAGLGAISTVHAKDTAHITIQDTVGAGDCFFAGFIASLLYHEQDVPTALIRAIACASLNIQRVGCEPPTQADIDAWLAKQSIHMRYGGIQA